MLVMMFLKVSTWSRCLILWAIIERLIHLGNTLKIPKPTGYRDRDGEVFH